MDTKEFIIERVTTFSAEVVQAVRSLVAQEGNNYQILTDSDFKEIVTSPQSFFFVARYVPTGQVVGMIMTMIYRIPYTRKAYMDDIVVDSAFRKKGIATQLIEQAITAARDQHAAYFDFTASVQREAGNALYQKLGFQKRESNVYRLKIPKEDEK